MIAITLYLEKNTQIAFQCPTSGTLYDQLAELAMGLSGRDDANTEVIELEIEENGATRGLVFAARSLVALESVPANIFSAAQPPVVAQSAPYVRIPNFLGTTANNEIMSFALSRSDDFFPSGVKSSDLDKGGYHDAGVRNSLTLARMDGLPTVFETDLRELIPVALDFLNIPAPEIFDLEIQLTTHNDGAFYKMHLDNHAASASSRQMTFVYYFHQDPALFSGGDIRLFDTIPQSEQIAESYVDVEPVNNTLLLFSSDIPHEVLRVDCPTKKFADGRFTLNGWVRF